MIGRCSSRRLDVAQVQASPSLHIREWCTASTYSTSCTDILLELNRIEPDPEERIGELT
jgi:hypothetical protein